MPQDSKPGLEHVLPRVEAALAGMPGSAPPSLGAFARLVLESAGFEAIAGYDPQTLAAFIRLAYAFIETKPNEDPAVRVTAAELPQGASTRRVATVQTLNADMPFLVDSVMGEVQAKGLSPLLVAHPLFKTRRNGAGRLLEILGPGDRNWSDGTQESYIAVVLDPLDEMVAHELERSIPEVLAEVRAAVTDWQAMLARIDRAIGWLQQDLAASHGVVGDEAITFCRWLRDGNFTLLGSRDLKEEGGQIVAVAESGLGLMRCASVPVPGHSAALRPPVTISKSAVVSRVHRRVAMDRIVIGGAADNHRTELVGLFTSSAYTQSPRSIPLLRSKVASVVARSGHPPESHAGKALTNVIETFPRDELFEITDELLASWADAILDLDLRPRVRLLARADATTISAFVYMPRDRFSTAVRERVGAMLASAWHGRIAAFTPFFAEGPLVRVHYTIAGDASRPVDVVGLETRIKAMVRTWEDKLAEAFLGQGEMAALLSAKYRHAFTAGYQEMFSAERAMDDVARIERLGPERPVAIDFYRTPAEPPGRIRAAVYRFDAPIPLSERVPVLENLGFSVIDERTYRVMPQLASGKRDVALHDMVLETADGAPLEIEKVDGRLEASFLAVFAGAAENDRFNRLVLTAGLDWRGAALLRALAGYMRQIRSPFGPTYVSNTLVCYPGVTRDLIEMFRIRHEPDLEFPIEERRGLEQQVRARIEQELAAVTSLDEDRIIRQLVNLIGASLRTNFYQLSNGEPPATIAIKFASREIEGLPEPKPFREIWVYSPRVEGVHLRFAPIARGGIRWSDRAQDFRTEVLGLCKAQQVKNAVIVPHGAKGGFLPKHLPRTGSRDDIAREGIAAYRIFIGALLDLTDNLEQGGIVPPERVIRHDGDDPYLVVAADKGTATFSDTANEIAISRGFWLGDAFASGGSAGYDHKVMGITARGAWEGVKRHFREMNKDIQRDPFNVIGVGDMSGDVFGNGMLLSPATRLLAAFDHRDIFIDPDPDVRLTFAERRRLFGLARSSWQDFDRGVLSSGGGVFPRSAKSIAITPEMQAVFGITEATLTPSDLIRAILKAPCDLIWLGGIGTYIKASDETDDQAGDRANDVVRINATEVRAKVVGEGANLGVTQRGRIEFARIGGRIDTDFIDNSAGVNTSDQEVNIKIALSPAVQAGKLDPESRKRLLASMTDDVAALSTRNTYQQTLALSLAELRGAADLGYLQRLMQVLEGKGLLDRKLEALPSNGEIAQRQAAGRGLARPELAVVLSFAKIALTSDLLATDVPDGASAAPMLHDYFPTALRLGYAEGIEHHRLRREIITTVLTNGIINRGGPAFAVRMADETGRPVSDIAYAFLAARTALGLAELWRRIDALDGQIDGAFQLELYRRVQDVLISTTRWFARRAEKIATTEHLVQSAAGQMGEVQTHVEWMPPRLAATYASEVLNLERGSVPADLARSLALLPALAEAPAVADLASISSRPALDCARVLLAAEEQLRVPELESRAGEIAIRDHFDRLALDAALADIRRTTEHLARQKLTGDALSAAQNAAERSRDVVDEILGNGALTVSRLTVAAQRVRGLAGA